MADRAALKAIIAKAEKSEPVTLTIVRHGATALNGESNTSVDRERGWSNIPLTAEGREEAERAAKKLRGKGFGAVVSSDLERARETAAIIGRALGLKPQLSSQLRPWNLGTLTGRSMREATPQLAEYARNKPDTPVPEGESFNRFRRRAFTGLSDALAMNRGREVLFIAHHRVERLIVAWDKAGQPIDHDIDIAEFLKKGDAPGGIVRIPTFRALLDGGLSKRFTHAQVDYGRGHEPEFCRTCEYSDHRSPPTCSYVTDIAKGGWCVLWEKA
jgi:broad specificity phosphatase PhoE